MPNYETLDTLEANETLTERGRASVQVGGNIYVCAIQQGKVVISGNGVTHSGLPYGQGQTAERVARMIIEGEEVERRAGKHGKVEKLGVAKAGGIVK